jgi:hypothetical protein
VSTEEEGVKVVSGRSSSSFPALSRLPERAKEALSIMVEPAAAKARGGGRRRTVGEVKAARGDWSLPPEKAREGLPTRGDARIWCNMCSFAFPESMDMRAGRGGVYESVGGAIWGMKGDVVSGMEDSSWMEGRSRSACSSFVRVVVVVVVVVVVDVASVSCSDLRRGGRGEGRVGRGEERGDCPGEVVGECNGDVGAEWTGEDTVEDEGDAETRHSASKYI